MNPQKKYAFIGIVFFILAGLFFIRVPERGENQEEHTTNSGEIIGNALVGQTFVASKNNISGVGVMMATYSGRSNKYPVTLHIRDSAKASEDLRTVSANPEDFGDNQFYRFAFNPIADSFGKTYFFAVDSPDSEKGNAVAVNLNTKDPYPSGTAYIVRDSNKPTTDKIIQASGKQKIDVAFQVFYNVPLGAYTAHTAKDAIMTFISTWHNNRQLYLVWTGAIIPSILCASFILFLFRTKKPLPVWKLLAGLAVSALCIRIIYALSLPFTDDEGNYLYDAWSLLHGHFAGGDGYVKAPVVIAWIALWEAILGHTAIAGRVASSIAGSLLVYPIFVFVRSIWNTRAGLISACLWALMGASIVATTYVHTQPVALFFGVSGIALLVYALREKQASWKWLIFAGIFIGLAVASRKSMLALGPVVILLLTSLSSSWGAKLKNTLYVGIGFFAILGLFFTFAYGVYGPEGIVEAIGINSAEDGSSTNEPEELEKVRAYSLKGMTPFFRESLPLILLFLLGSGLALEKSSQRIGLFSKLVWILPLLVYWWAWSFFSEYEGSAFMKYGIPILWPLFGIFLVGSAVLPRQKKDAGINTGITQALLGPLWLGSFVFFYMNWIKFHANYISEFIPPLAIIGGVGIELFISRVQTLRFTWLKYVSLGALLIVAVWSTSVSNFITYVFEHTGTFDQKAAQEAAVWAQQNIPMNEPIFTGASLIPYISGHRTALDISHPRWYAYEFTRKNPKRLNTFLPPAEAMVQAYRDARWMLVDKQTSFSFFMEYSEIEAGVATDWKSVKGISNGSNTLTFYERIK